MKKLFTIFFLLFSAASFSQSSQNIVVSEVYGGGGNSGAAFTHDFIELFNPTATPKYITNWSVQYGVASNSSWSKVILSGTIQPGLPHSVLFGREHGQSVAASRRHLHY